MNDAQLGLDLSGAARAGDRIGFPAPAAPGSETSRLAAEALDRKNRRREVTRCLEWFARQTAPRTRNELADALYAGHLGSACGRVNDLMIVGWIEEVGRAGKRATLSITSAGRHELGKAVRP